MAMLFGKKQAELDRMFKETGHQNAYSIICSKEHV
jgi:hypothetical protein